MGIEAQEEAEYSKKLQGYDYQHGHSYSHTLKHKLNPLVLVIVTNLVTIYIVTGPFSSLYHHPPHHNNNFNSILQELNTTKSQLAASHSLLSELHHRLNSTNLLVQALLIDLTTRQQDKQYSRNNDGERSSNEELNLALASYKLPFGYSQWIGSDEIHSPIGAVCLRFQDELNQYMSYDIGGECLADEVFAQMLVSKGCEPLPKRRCHPKSPKGFVEPNQDLQDTLWKIPPDSNIVWDPYTCKSHKCLIERKNNKGYCKDCFDLQGREKGRWIFDDGGLDFGIDRVLGTKRSSSTISMGLDIGGGTGTFAARMKERNVTIITSTLDLDGPFSHFIASRGLIPIHLSISHRLPFFENTLDIVHSMEFIGNWLPETMLEFLLYDVYRVLRPGGIFWLEHFFCFGSQVNRTYLPMFDRVGFNRLRWHAGRKIDHDGIQKNEWYISALLEKPVI
ncbi:hypothetical protein HN51_065196 [Arachis hypogaea]|uniref:Methyltransferase type 11 domain-containing protein n=1 Tax=Arachis hypogaea TaxID=3818 RepID=A0A444ZDK2_ARAHY|nr:putative methyltransferase [Arachis hypogaea]QHO06333.1 putative methyltransferase [Arachis hypogaea]RYR12208.1 hypothetical protein Ahy_B04g069739 [Arachis hypogaea]